MIETLKLIIIFDYNMKKDEIKEILGRIKVEQTTLLRFDPNLPEPKKRSLVREIEKKRRESSAKTDIQ